MRPRVVVAANSCWNIVNFRSGLIRGLQQAGYDPVVLSPFEATTTGRMADLGVEHIHIPIDRSGMNPIADGLLLMRYLQILRRVKPAAFLGFTIKPNIYGCLAARFLNLPAIANVSGLGTAFADRGLLVRIVRILYRAAFASARRVFFQNDDDQAEFVARGIIRLEQAALLPGSGVDLEHFSPEPLPLEGPVYLFVGRLLADKGVREFVSAARIVRAEFPTARFQLLGPIDQGNPTSIAQSELDGWISQGAVEYLGVTDDVRSAIGGASAIVLPSYYREGVPRSLLEAAAMARPLISTDMSGCRELVVDQPGGIVCRPRDANSLAESMREFARKSPEERTAMGAASRRLVEERFNEERVIRAYVDELAGLNASV